MTAWRSKLISLALGALEKRLLGTHRPSHARDWHGGYEYSARQPLFGAPFGKPRRPWKRAAKKGWLRQLAKRFD